MAWDEVRTGAELEGTSARDDVEVPLRIGAELDSEADPLRTDAELEGISARDEVAVPLRLGAELEDGTAIEREVELVGTTTGGDEV